jgi:predicted mannosyl-3-phosphoglycerate phosphatase (HAD superfamily)
MHTAIARERGQTCASGTLVIFTRVEGLLRQRATAPCEVSRDVMTSLISARVPLVLVSEASEMDVRELQREIGVLQPFICDRGAALHIPPAYFSDADESPGGDAWEVFSFDTRSPTAAMRLLAALFIARGHDKILTVGLGCDWTDSAMLAAVDVPIVVRDQRQDQTTLLQYVPGAYLTTATGTAGWLEAVIGPQYTNA